jgi:DNA gyrase subunit A
MGGEQKLKEGDEIVSTVETTNKAELLFFTDKCQVYKSKASEFEDSKASVLGDFVPSKLGFEADEKSLCMIVTTDYSGFMMFFFENGKAAKVNMQGYDTKTNRKKLIKAYSDKAPLVSAFYLKEDTEYVLTSTAGRVLLVNTGAISIKTTKDTAGVNVMTLKKYHKVQSARPYVDGEFAKPYRYRTKTLPAAGATLSADDTAEQLSLLD